MESPKPWLSFGHITDNKLKRELIREGKETRARSSTEVEKKKKGKERKRKTKKGQKER